MSLIQWDEYPRDRSIYVMDRTAIDCFGCVGSLYDGYRDEVIDRIIVSHYKKSGEFRDIRRCKIVCNSKTKNENILGMIEIDEATRLSLVLNLRKNDGIGKIIDYDIPIKDNIRLLWYTHIKRTIQLPEDPKDIQYINNQIISKMKGTHIISSVEWGIDIGVVLQLPNDIDTIKEIDDVLDKVRTFLLNDQSILFLEQNEKSILKKIVNTNVYSNINEIKSMNTLIDVCMCIQINKYSIIDQPISYKIRPITWLYSQYNGEGNTFIPLPERLINSLEKYIFKIRTDMNKLMRLIDEELPRQLIGKLPKVLSALHKMCLNVKDQCENEIERFIILVLRVRKGEIKISKIKNALKDKQSIIMKTTIRNLDRILHDFENKISFINQLNQQNFRYINIKDYGIKKTDNQKIIESKIVKNDQYYRILCSNDLLNNDNREKFFELQDILIKERENNLNLQLIYADFSYSSYKLKNLMILPRILFNIDNDKLKQEQTSSPITKIHQSVTTPVEIKSILSKSTKISSNNFLSTTQKTNNSLSTRSKALSVSFDENLTYIESTIDTSITDLSTTDIQTYNPLPTKIDIYSETSGETISPDPVPTQIQDYTSAETKTETPIPSLIDMTVKSELSLPSVVEKPTITSPPKVTELVQLPSILNSENKFINIILIGETGVGKSTFINALANYLKFDTLSEAENDQPVVLIPGSFLFNNGDNIQERIIKFGDINDEQNKHLKHPGRSITERCRSYEFYLNDNNNHKLRIIDTPGFGDARGLLEDDHRMQHIIKYIKQFSPLNKICFLLNANEIRVNIFLRSCLTQLFSFLGPNIRNRIIFCFTNSRPAFYAPGKTVPLLKKMLTSFTLANIPFTKENIFSYDNESFRYLVGLQNGITFNHLEKKGYEISWSKSVAESKRFIHYICGKRTVQRIPFD